MNLLKHLRSNQFAIIIAILSVLVQSFHSFTAFYNTSSLQNGWGIAQAVLFAVIIDLAILFYTVRGRRDISMYAAIAMVTINAYYYYQHLGVTFEFIFGCFLSLIIPISVYFYSEEIKDDSPVSKADNESIRAEIEFLSKESSNWYKEAQTWEKRYNEVFTGWKGEIDKNKEIAISLELVKNSNEALKNDLDYVRKLLDANHIEINEVLNTEELNPDALEEKDIIEKKSITITRTGGPKL